MMKKVTLLAVAVLMFAAVVPGLNAQIYLLDEDFEGSFPPTDWTRINHMPWGSYYNWNRRNDGSNYRHDTYSAGVYYAYEFSYFGSAYYEDEWLITPVIDLSGYTEGTVLLGFNAATYYYFYTYPSGSHSRDDFHQTVHVSTDGGSSWDEPLVDLWQDYPGRIYIDDDPNPFLFDLSDYIGEQIQIGFNAYTYPRYTYFYAYSYRYYYVDDVWVTYQSGGGGRDLVCVRINQPVGDVPKEPITPKAVIMNNGGALDSCFAKCEITGPGPTYDKGNTEGIVYLEPGEMDEVKFPDWTPPGEPGDQYRVEVTVYLWPERTTEDDDPTNNTKVEHCTIESAVQVDAIEVATPVEGDTIDRMIPEATCQNVGTETATDFCFYCEILSLGYMTEPYIDSVGVASLEPEATFSTPFAEWICDDSMLYQARFFAAVPTPEGRELLGEEFLVVFQGEPYEGIAEEPFAEPTSFELVGTTVNFTLESATDVTIRVYDAAGNRVTTLVKGTHNAGSHSVKWDADVAPGVYFVKMITPEFSASGKMVVLY